jgi:hypothetical protein
MEHRSKVGGGDEMMGEERDRKERRRCVTRGQKNDIRKKLFPITFQQPFP